MKYMDYFEKDCYYHVYNRSIEEAKLFYNDNNYKYFLDHFQGFMAPYFEILSYCLIPNHFHFLVKVKPSKEKYSKTLDYHCVISEAYRRFAITYAQAINKQEDRKGSLFMRPFKRIRVFKETYMKQLVLYIHHNPIHHGLTESFAEYKWSSYSTYLGNRYSLIKVDNEVIKLFEDLGNFIIVHDSYKAKKLERELVLEGD